MKIIPALLIVGIITMSVWAEELPPVFEKNNVINARIPDTKERINNCYIIKEIKGKWVYLIETNMSNTESGPKYFGFKEIGWYNTDNLSNVFLRFGPEVGAGVIENYMTSKTSDTKSEAQKPTTEEPSADKK